MLCRSELALGHGTGANWASTTHPFELDWTDKLLRVPITDFRRLSLLLDFGLF